MTSHDRGPMSPKPFSPSEESDSRILRAIVGPKNLTTPAHFIMSPKPTQMRKKWPRTDKKSPNSLETLPRTILFSASQILGEKNGTPAKTASQSTPRKRTSTVGYPWEYGVGTIQRETVTSADRKSVV